MKWEQVVCYVLLLIFLSFDFEQVASILRQAGQDSIRLVVARPVDPSVPQFALNSTIVPTKVLTDPQGTVIQNQ